MTPEEYIFQLEGEVRAMRETIKGRANRDRGLPRKSHSGFVIQSKYEGTFADIRNGVVQSHKQAFVVSIEAPIPASQRALPLKKALMQTAEEIAAQGIFEGVEAPKLYGAKLGVPRGASFWVITAYYNKEWTEYAGKEEQDNEITPD